jgi:hypothetical protein
VFTVPAVPLDAAVPPAPPPSEAVPPFVVPELGSFLPPPPPPPALPVDEPVIEEDKLQHLQHQL